MFARCRLSTRKSTPRLLCLGPVDSAADGARASDERDGEGSAREGGTAESALHVDTSMMAVGSVSPLSPTATAPPPLTSTSDIPTIMAALKTMSAERIHLNKRQFLEVLTFYDIRKVLRA